MQLAQDEFKVICEHILARQVAQFDCQVHAREVEKPQGVVILGGLGPRDDLVEELAQNGYLAR